MADFIRQTLWFPVIQSVHILGLTIVVGTIALVDFRLLDFAMRRKPAPELAASLAPWTWAGLMTVLTTGPLLFGADLSRYVQNPAFVLKIGLLVLALFLHFTLHRYVIRDDTSLQPSKRKIAAAISLALWSGVVLAGRAIADFDIK